MDTELYPNISGNVQNLRNMWSTKVKEEQKLLKPKPTVYRSQSHIPKQEPKIELEPKISLEKPNIHQKVPTVTFFDQSKSSIDCEEKRFRIALFRT